MKADSVPFQKLRPVIAKAAPLQTRKLTFWANMTQVKRASATTSSTGDHLVVIEGLDSNGETRVYYGDTSDAKNMETKLSTFPKPRDMNAAIQQVRL